MATSDGQRNVKHRLAGRVRRAVISVTAVNECRSDNDPKSTFRQLWASTRPVPLFIVRGDCACGSKDRTLSRTGVR